MSRRKRKPKVSQQRSCQGKRRHPDETAAIAHLHRLRKLGQRVVHYRCKHCAGWHVGHPPYFVRQSMAARRG